MSTAVGSTKPTGKRVTHACILLLLSISSLGFAGCAGLVGSSNTSNSTPTSLAISSLQATNPTTSGFQVNWATNVPANSGVDYGTTTAYGSTLPANSALVTSHQVAVTGLKPATMYHFRARSTDSTGSSVTSADMTATTVADTTAPTVSITSPAANATLAGTANVTATASDNVAVASVQFKVDGANTGPAITTAPYAYSLDTTTLSNSNHILTAVATDTSNNSATSASITVKVNNAVADTTPPTVSLTAPTSGATVSATVTMSANATDNVSVASVQFQLDGANVGAAVVAAPYTFAWDTTKSANGAHTLTAVAKDGAGNSATSAAVSVTVNNATTDTTPPTVSITAPANGATVSGTISVTANASDNVGVASVQFQLDGANLGTVDLATPYTTSWNTTTASNGTHILRAIAKDAANNATTSAAVTVTVSNASADTTPPTVPTGLTATAVSSSQINLSWTASTDNVGVTGYNVYRAGTKINSTTGTTFQDGGLAASTTFSYTVAAFDAAGNTSAQSASASATTLSSGGGGGLPTTLGWYQIPNTMLTNVCPSGFNCENVIVPWSGGIADTSRNRLIVWGGGHTDYGGNEVYALDLNALTLTRLNNPSPQVSGCVEVTSDGKPPSRHTYDGLAYITHADRMMAVDGSMAPTGCASQATWTLAMANLGWQNMNPTGTAPLPNGGVAASDYDPNTKNVFIHTTTYGQFASYNFDTNKYTTLATFADVNYYVTAVVDPKRRFFFMFGAGGAYKIDISGNDPAYTLKTLAATGCSFIGVDAPGAGYDTVQDRIVGWSGGNTVYLYNPDTDSCTSVTYPNGPGAQQTLGTFGRFRYFPSLGVFGLVNDGLQNAYALRLTAPSGGTGGTGPVISGVTSTSITTNSATVNWTTDVASTSQVEYGTTTSYGTLTTLNATLVTAHTAAVVGLGTNTLYHYRVHSKNSGGTESISGDFTFQTNNTLDTTPPTISITSPAGGATVSGNVSVSANASDNVGVTSVQFQLDGANLGAPLTAAPYATTWNAATASNGTHTLSASAQDAAGNVGSATAVTVTVSNSTDPALADFQARCAAPGVLRCEGWDNATDFTPATGSGYDSGLYPAEDGTFQGVQDTTTKISGAGSLKFIIRPGTVHPMGSNPSGLWKANFGPDNSITKFGPHTTLYMQFRLRLDPNMINFDWTTVSGQGWKVFIAFGPIPGPSCTGAQFVQENTYQTNVATAYTSCGSPSLDTNNGVPPMLIEQGDYNCPYNSSGGYASNPSCFAYPVNTWMTEYWVVQIGDWGQPNSTFTAYIAPDGQPLKKFISLPNFAFNSGGTAQDALMQIILQPYFSGATNATTNPSSAMWFDELIISTQPIAAPQF